MRLTLQATGSSSILPKTRTAQEPAAVLDIGRCNEDRNVSQSNNVLNLLTDVYASFSHFPCQLLLAVQSTV